MGSVYRKTATKPLPVGAEMFERKGEQFAKWRDAKGKSRTAKTTTGQDGSPRIVVEVGTFYAKYRNGSGIVREVPTGCRTRDGALSVLKELTGRAERVKAKIFSPVEDAAIDWRESPLDRHLADKPDFIAELERRGRERSLIYKTLLLTGLRKNELASLTVGQLELATESAFVKLNAADDNKWQRFRRYKFRRPSDRA